MKQFEVVFQNRSVPSVKMEADAYNITEGLLWLYKGQEAVATFADWGYVRVSK